MSIQNAVLKLKTNSAGAFGRPSSAIKFLAAIAALFALLLISGREPHNVPWYYLAAGVLVVLLMMGGGFLMFVRGSRSAEDVSISPRNR